MKKLMVIVVMLGLAIVSGSALAAEKEKSIMEIKGFRLGMNEREVLAQYEKMRIDEEPAGQKKKHIKHDIPTCKNSQDKVLSDRRCLGVLFLASGLGVVTFHFYTDSLAFVSIDTSGAGFNILTDALQEKYGVPESSSPAEVIWKRPGEVLTLLKKKGDESTLFFNSLASSNELAHRKAVITKKNAANL